eukprot:s1_g2085.t1
MVASFFALYRWYESEDAPRDADLIDRWRNIVGKIEPVPDSELSEPPVQRLWMLVDSIHESEKRYASILDEISVAREWEAARRTELSAKLSEDNQVVSSLTSVIDTFGQARPADTGPVAIANALIRIGAVGLTIFIIQILLSFTRYHLRMADHFRGAITALQISDGDVDKALKVAELTSNSVDFGKERNGLYEFLEDLVNRIGPAWTILAICIVLFVLRLPGNIKALSAAVDTFRRTTNFIRRERDKARREAEKRLGELDDDELDD